MVLGGLGGPGGITNRRGMKKCPGGLILVRFGWIYEGFMRIFWFILDHLDMQIHWFLTFSIKSTFEPITTPLKWVLADAAWKVSASVENIESIRAGKCKMVPKHWCLLEYFVFITSSEFLHCYLIHSFNRLIWLKAFKRTTCVYIYIYK